MNLLQHSWSDMLLLDHIHQRMHNNLADDTQLPNGQRFDLLTLALLGVTSAADQLHQLTMKLAELKFDTIDYTCLKFLLLLNPGECALGEPATPRGALFVPLANANHRPTIHKQTPAD